MCEHRTQRSRPLASRVLSAVARHQSLPRAAAWPRLARLGAGELQQAGGADQLPRRARRRARPTSVGTGRPIHSALDAACARRAGEVSRERSGKLVGASGGPGSPVRGANTSRSGATPCPGRELAQARVGALVRPDSSHGTACGTRRESASTRAEGGA